MKDFKKEISHVLEVGCTI